MPIALRITLFENHLKPFGVDYNNRMPFGKKNEQKLPDLPNPFKYSLEQ